MGNTNRYSTEQAMGAMKLIDKNFDGRASKIELYNALKYLMSETVSYGNNVNKYDTSYENNAYKSYSNNNSNAYNTNTYSSSSYKASPVERYTYNTYGNREPSTLDVASSHSDISNIGYHTSVVTPGYTPTYYNPANTTTTYL